MRYLGVGEILRLYQQLMRTTGGQLGVRDLGLLQSAVAQPKVTFEGSELYASTVDKAAALGYSLVMNHPMIDGNKRLGHAAMELFLALNGFEIQADVGEQERIMLHLASGELARDEFVTWLEKHVVELRAG